MRIIFFILTFLALYLPISAQTADFSFTIANGQSCSPVTINFISNTNGSPLGYLWNFGNGVQSNVANPSYTYTQPGTYQVTLTVVFMQKVATVVKPIVVNPPITVSVTADRNYICKPGIINFTGVGSGNVGTYNWGFGDGSPNMVTNNNAVSHNFNSFGLYTVTLVATQNTGCTASSFISVNIAPPPIAVNISQTNGCAPATVGFGANVTVPVNGSVANYKWNYGDGSPVSTTTLNTSSHIYNLPHVAYAPVLTITTNEGCTNTASFGTVMLGTKATATASPKLDTICHSDSMVINAQSANSSLFNFAWGDGTNTVSTSPVAHKYATLGAKTIMVSAYDNGCTGNAITVPVFIKGLIASYTYLNNCPNDSLFIFTNTSQGTKTSILWNFGDGVTDNVNDSPSHQYISNGAYVANMTVADNISGCSESYAQTIYIANPILIANKTNICRGDTVIFNVKIDFPNPLATYTWNIDGSVYGPTSTPFITIVADKVGTFYNSVLINNGTGYCTTTISGVNPLIVKGPDPQFFIPALSCLNMQLQPNNLTLPVINGDTVKIWQWNFGAAKDYDANYQPAPYTYQTTGTYNITLKVTDQYNCTYAMVKPVQIAPVPFVLSLPHTDSICLGEKAYLIAYHFDPLGWSPAALVSCANCDSINITPTADTKFIATTTNAYGCKTSDTSFVKVYTPFVAAATFLDTAICFMDTLQLNIGPKGKTVIWLPSDGLNDNKILNPLAFPKQSTSYTAIVSDSLGCFTDTNHINIIINPLPIVDAGPSAKYPYHANYLFQPTYSPNTVAYQWSPITQLSCNTCAVPQGVANISQTYTVKTTSDSGCVASDTVTIFVECMGANLLMPTAFTPDNNINNLYYPFGRGMSIITKFVIYNRLGQLVYQRMNFPPNDAGYGWDGKSNSKDQPVGTYVYMVESICDLGQTISQKGTFVLIR